MYRLGVREPVPFRPMTNHVQLFTRHSGNPIITARELHYPANSVMNAAAAIVGGQTLLLMRVEDLRGIYHLTVARSADGATDWRFDPSPTFLPSPDQYREEVWGVEDPRVTWLGEREVWAVAYTAYSHRGPLVSIALTPDFREFQRLGPAMPPDDKDAALFPRTFDGRWIMVHRPTPIRGGAHMWLSYSPDLRHWGDHTLLIDSRDGAWWDAGKIGLGPPPLETSEGWLVMYHGAHLTARGAIYRLGLALLDLDDPRQVMRRSDEWVFGPQEPYERTGDVAEVVFPCGWTVDEPSGELRMYYGAADTSLALATARLQDVLDFVRTCPSPRRDRTTEA
jgi:predicted GH43/DUF377 family glycosyl hydrolase